MVRAHPQSTSSYLDPPLYMYIYIFIYVSVSYINVYRWYGCQVQGVCKCCHHTIKTLSLSVCHKKLCLYTSKIHFVRSILASVNGAGMVVGGVIVSGS